MFAKSKEISPASRDLYYIGVISCKAQYKEYEAISFLDSKIVMILNVQVSRKVCTKINRAIRKAWPYPEVKRVTSHFFRSFFVASTFHYFNERSSISAWASDVLAHESLETSFPYTGLLITGYGSLTFNAERSLQGMARLSL